MNFRLVAEDGGARAGLLVTPHGEVETPAFMPVGTQGTVKGLAPRELREVGTCILLANTYHLYLRPGVEIVSGAGGLHSFIGWDGPVLTDSGGYQVFSLAPLRKLSDEGVLFRSHVDGSEHFLSPEKVIDIQRGLGSDVMMVLDECPPPDAGREAVARAVARTTAWAKRSAERAARRPPGCALFGIVQGGVHPDLRAESAGALVSIGFDGYAIGGLGLGEPREAMLATVETTVGSLPSDRPRYFMGLGSPVEILEVIRRGIDLFDSVLPTRLGRHGTAMTARGNLVIRNAAFARDYGPLEEDCDCYACGHFSRAYLRHLVAAGEILGLVLLTHHNLRFLHRVVARAREAVLAREFEGWSAKFREGFAT